MYKVSEEYKTVCKALTRQSKAKIIIGNITYDGSQYIKDYPKFSQSNDTMIGGFPIKSAEFSLWIKNGPIDLVNKPIKIYRGLVVENSVEWIPQGIFFAEDEDVTTSDTGEYITVKCYDDAKRIGTVIYKDNNTYPIAETNYIKNVISFAGYELDEEIFIESNYVMKQKPNMPENASCREIISRYAEQRGAIALFSRLGKVQIKKPTEVDFNYLFYEYKKLNCENTYGPLNQLIIGNKGIENNVIFPSGKTTFPWTINDNPFIDLLRSERREEIYNQIEGQELTPFTLESALDSFYLDLNDVITIQKKDKSIQKFTILSLETENRLKCKIGASVQNSKSISYELAGSIKSDIESVKLEVDYNKKQITAAVEKSNEALSQTTNLTIELGKIQGLISESVDTTKSAEGVGTVTLENINQSEPVMLQIHPTNEDISYLYPRDDLFPSDNLFLKGRTVIFENTTTKKKVEYELPSDLLKVDSVYDEFNLDLKNRICSVTKRIGVNSSGENYVLAQDQTLNFTYPTIALEDGNYKIYLQSFSTAHIFCRLMTKNIYTEQFATNIQLESAITQLRDSITLSVKQTLTNYSTTTEMNSAIIMKANEITNSVNNTFKSYATTTQLNSAISQKANEITSSVSETYATKNQLKNYSTTSQMNSAITQKADSITSSVNGKFTTVNGNIKNLSASLELKLNTKDFYTELNGKADKITFTGNRFSWKSTNSSMSESGTLTAKNVDISGKITATSGSFSGSITATSGKIGGFDIGTTSITSTYNDYRVYVGNASNDNKDFLVVRTGTSGNYKYPFYVHGDGSLYAEKATIQGAITATSGKIANWNISAGKIYGGTASTGVAVMQLPSANTTWVFAAGGKSHDAYADCPFRVSKSGEFYATKAHITGAITATSGSFTGTITSNSGSIGGWSIASDGLKSGSSSLLSNGNLNLYPSAGGVYRINNGVRLNATSGVQISSNGGSPTFPSKDLNLLGLNGSSAYMACRWGDNGSERSAVTCADGALYLASAGVIYANGVAIGGSSSIATKENIKDLTQEKKDEVYNLLKNVPLKEYDYKKQYGYKDNYGFLIEDIEDSKLKDLLHIVQNKENKDIKVYSSEDLVRLLLITTQEMMKKIEKLESRI